MSIEAGLREEFDNSERQEGAVLTALPYVLLAVCTTVTLLPTSLDVHVPATLGLTLAMAIWLLWFTLYLEQGRNRRLAVLYFTGLMALGAGLVVLAPWYAIVVFVGYIHAYLCLPGRWRYVGVSVTALILAVAYMGGVDNINAETWWIWLAVSLVSVVLSQMFFYFGDVSERRNHRQKQALAQLHEANVKLEEALEENAGLHAQLVVQAREAGVLDERQRIAREMHDTLAQSLAGILTQLQAAEQSVVQPPTVRRHLTKAMNLARESLTEARRTVHAVEPELLAEARLPEAISDVTRRWSEVNQIDAVLTTTGDPRPMHADVEVTLLRTAQEALANIAKHAKAGRVGLTLSYMEDLVTLDVRDDGVGFESGVKLAGGLANGGFGLAGMRQRIQRLAGRLEIESEPDGGTAISASVPAIPAGGGQ